MINFNAVDLSESNSKEVISFFWRSVYNWLLVDPGLCKIQDKYTG